MRTDKNIPKKDVCEALDELVETEVLPIESALEIIDSIFGPPGPASLPLTEKG